MKILLINPPRKNEIIGNNPTLIEEERGYNPPLGLLYLAGYLRNHSPYKTKVIDAQVEELSYDELNKEIELFDPDVVGITAMSFTMLDVLKTMRIVKAYNKKIKVVLGGPHAHLFPDESIELEDVDFVVLGEGEVTFKELLDHIDDTITLREIPGLVFIDKGQIIKTAVKPPIQNIDALPFPDRQAVPYKKYTSILSKGGCVTTIFTSRGCPYKCTFCDRPHMGETFRARSAKNVVDELEECVSLGINEFLFYDDTFCIDRKRVVEICKEIVKRKLKISWDIRTRINTVNDEILIALKAAGCQGIHYGIESGSTKILKILKKGINIEQAKKVFAVTRKYKIKTLAYFMIGNPSETSSDIAQTFRLMKDLKPDYVHLTILTPFPGTKIYFDGLKSGSIKYDYWREFAQKPTSDFCPPYWEENFTKDELNRYLQKGYKSFYIRPSYIWTRLKKIRSMNELKKHVVAGLKIFSM